MAHIIKNEKVQPVFFSKRKSIWGLVVFVFVAGALFTSCSTSAEKVEKAQDEVKEANKDLDKANKEYLEDVENYRKEVANKIEANNQSIAEFKTRIAHEKKEARAKYDKRIAELEEKNIDMKKKLDDYQVDGKEKWESFKAEFSHDMDELGKAFKDLTVKNVK